MNRDGLKLAGGAIGAGLIVAAVVGGVVSDQNQRALVASGICTKVTEAIYTPPPTAHSSCWREGAHQSCSTYHTQSAPYLRSLWRCPKEGDQGGVVEFWRRTTEEFRR